MGGQKSFPRSVNENNFVAYNAKWQGRKGLRRRFSKLTATHKGSWDM